MIWLLRGLSTSTSSWNTRSGIRAGSQHVKYRTSHIRWTPPTGSSCWFARPFSYDHACPWGWRLPSPIRSGKFISQTQYIVNPGRHLMLVWYVNFHWRTKSGILSHLPCRRLFQQKVPDLTLQTGLQGDSMVPVHAFLLFQDYTNSDRVSFRPISFESSHRALPPMEIFTVQRASTNLSSPSSRSIKFSTLLMLVTSLFIIDDESGSLIRLHRWIVQFLFGSEHPGILVGKCQDMWRWLYFFDSLQPFGRKPYLCEDWHWWCV